MTDFVQRLRDRKLVQWALAYAAAVWLTLQVLSLVTGSFEWPPTVMRIAVIVATAAFPIALVLAWYHGERGAQKVSGTELLILALLLAIGGGLLWRVAQSPREPAMAAAETPDRNVARAAKAPASAPATDKSIAVLPFANLSRDPDNAYFADGMQDEILTKLAKIGALRVVSRTSTQRFGGTAERNLGEIALQLGVANILEGSVQKAGNSVHINVQLIEAATDRHLWAESYNRTLEDVFGVQGEVAQAVAAALKATLTGAEKDVVAAKGTENPKAYEAYLRGRATANWGVSFSDEAQAVGYLYEATRADPKFAQAWAAAAVNMSDLYQNGFDSERSTAAAVKEAADAAMALQPDLAESLLARGAWIYRVERDYPKALDAFREALARQPGDLDILAELLFVERRMGRWDDATRHFEEIMARDPRNVSLRVQGAFEIYFWLRRYDETRAHLLQALKVAPDDTAAHACLAYLEQRLGRLDAAAQWLERIPATSRESFYEGTAWIEQLTFLRDYDGLVALARGSIARSDAELTNVDWLVLIRLGFAQRAAGHADLARATFGRLARILETSPDRVAHVVSEASITPLVYAGLGDHEKALKLARERIELFRNDTLETATAKTVLAESLAQKGDRDAAIALIPELLEIPAGITPALLKLDPLWDPIRDDPRFVALTRQPIARYEGVQR
jgi:TolB-like protein/Tfp pilus assembly protein PilF